MKARVFLIVAAITVAALLWSRQSHEPLSYYSSRSYVERANGMIRSGALLYDCPSDRIELTQRATNAERKWYEASYLKSDVELFNRNRELFGHFFVVSDCTLREINPFLRTIRLPFAKSVQWLGNVEYAGSGADATLMSSNGRSILINRAIPNAPYRGVRTKVGDTSDQAANLVHLDFAGGGQTPGVEVHGVSGRVVMEQRVKRGQPAEIRLLGNAVPEGRIAQLRTGDWLHLESSSPQPRSETFLFTGERTFERLSTVRTRNARLERTYAEEEPLLRWIGGEDGEEMLTFGEALARSLSNAIQQFDENKSRELANAFDVQLTIDRHLQAALDAKLSEHARRLVDNIAGGDPFAASVTVMNGKTGEILAAVSFPGENDLASMRPIAEEERRRLLVNHNFKRHPIGSAGKPLFYAAIASRHPFLLDMVIEPHAPEVLPRAPEARSIADEEEGERELMQFFLSTDYKLWWHVDRPMDFASAIERSCNKYTVELAALALAAPRERNERILSVPLDRVFTPQRDAVWPPPGMRSGISIGGQELTFAPGFGQFMQNDWKPVPPKEETSAVLLPGTLDRIDEAPFIETFGEITGVRTYGGLAAPDIDAESPDRLGRTALQTMHYDLRPWARLITKLTEGESSDRAWKVRAAFQAISPERVNLSLNQVTDLRTEFVSLLLGGASSQWTNIQLGEALSRLVRKRQVEATLVRGVHPRDGERPPQPERPAFADLAMNDEARTEVLRGMSRTIMGAQGTATLLAPEVRALRQRHPGFNIVVYSKTGSPTVERAELKPVGLTLAQMVRRGHLFFQNGRIHVAIDRKMTVPYAAAGTKGRAAFVTALGRAARASAATVGQNAGPRTVTRIIGFTDRFERFRGKLMFAAPSSVRLDPDTPMPFHVVSGRLVLNRAHPIFDPRLEADSSAVYMFSIVKWRGTGDPEAIPTPQDLEREDSRVITVVMYLDIGPGSQVAVEAARALIPTIEPLLE